MLIRSLPGSLVGLFAFLALGLVNVGSAAAVTWDDSLLEAVAPRDDQLVRDGAVRVKLRLAPGATLRKAELNGTSVRRRFKTRGNSVTATLTARRDGRALRRGRNFLRVVVGRGGKRGRVTSETISFTRVVPNSSLLTRFRAGHRARRGLRTTVVPSRLTARVRASLNGRNVSRPYRDGAPLRRAVRLGASDGLRHGLNRLQVLVYDFHGLYTVRKRLIRVGPRTTIAGAGDDRRVKAGGAVRLDGRASKRALRRDGKVRTGKLRYRWRILRKPRGSRARLSGRKRGRPVLRTDLPGTYRLELRTSQPSGGTKRTTSIDVAEVTAQPQPMVPVTTLAEVDGLSGIEVGVSRECGGSAAAAKPPCFYPNPGTGSDLQVVVLDRESLEQISNTAYAPTELGAFAAAMAKLATELEPAKGQKCDYAYDTSKLVLIAHREGDISDFANLGEGLGYFGSSPDDCSPGHLASIPTEGAFSYVAVPGTLAGNVARNEGGVTGDRDGLEFAAGNLVGFLKAAADDPAEVAALRSFESATEIPFDTRADDGAAVRIGDRELSLAGLPPGLAVFHFDPANPASSHFALSATITNVGGDSNAGLEWEKLAGVLDFPKGGTGLMVVSTGKLGGFATEPQAESFLDVLEQLENLGVNPDSFARAVNEAGAYSMISTADYQGRSIGAASSSAIAAGVPDYPGFSASDLPVNDGRLTGMLHRGADQTTFPVEADPSGQSQQPELRSVVFSDQTEWELTPAPEVGTASCQETAFAYVVVTAAGLYPAGSAPKLWEDARARACQGISHAGSDGARRADSLAGDACASEEVTAIGANGRNVRAASMALRGAYTTLTYELSESEVAGVKWTKGLPFTAADLTCAKNQMIDELAARRQTEKFFEVLRDPQVNLQGETVIHLNRIAEEVKTAALAPVASRLQPQPTSTAAFWASFGLGLLNGAAKLATLVAPEASPAWKAAARGVELTSTVAQSAVTGILSSGSRNPAAAADEYILLAAQIEREQIDVEAQIEQVLTAQQNGGDRSLAAILSDPRRMATVNERAKGAWSIDAETLELMQKAYEYRVAQLAYGAMLPQVYDGVLYDRYGSHGSGLVTQASQAICDEGHPFPTADPGTPKGLGQGNEYQAQAGVAVKGAEPSFLDFLTAEPGTFQRIELPVLAPSSLLEPVFEQPIKPNGSSVANAAGLYAPDFWFDYLEIERRVTRCEPENPPEMLIFPNPHGGPYQRVIAGAELWPF